ncbi:glycoside hydrolase, partial [Rozella allomycis CSF55]
KGHKKYEVRGTYPISSLLQELALASEKGIKHLTFDESKLYEPPVNRLSRMIKELFWPSLTRCIDEQGLKLILLDPKDRSFKRHDPRIYVPYDDSLALDYFIHFAAKHKEFQLEVIKLPKEITPEYVKSLNDKPGILTLKLTESINEETGERIVKANKFVVPGGRFNEMYGWDSYFEALGLMIDGYTDLAKSMVENFIYEIEHYGKILNANRSYYLTRSQPPFLTDMALSVYNNLPKTPENLEWLKEAMKAAIKEYKKVWTSSPRMSETGLSLYRSEGIGMPPETEPSHFNVILAPFAEKLGVDIHTYSNLYNNGTISEPELDSYFVHDRSVRESGHDTTYRLDGKCANLCTVDLNSLLYKYEVDIATFIQDHCDSKWTIDGTVETSKDWFEKAEKRKELFEKYLWNEEKGIYFDYNIKTKQQEVYESVTTLWPLWAGLTTQERAERVIKTSLDMFEFKGGLVCGTEKSRGEVGLSRPNRQWDYPFGWAPHQIMAWKALINYNHEPDAKRIAYRWLYMITKSFVDFNGVVPEKYDVVRMSHVCNVEYGNKDSGTPESVELLRWMNTSYQMGLTLMSEKLKRSLNALTPPEKVTFQ